MKRALIGLAVGLVPYVVHILLAGPGTVWRGMLIDPIFRLRSGRSLPVPPNPDHLEGIAKVIVLFDRWWPLPRLSIPQQLFAWFMLLALLAVALVGLGIWAVRRAPGAFRPRVLLAGALFGLGMFPQALQRADSAHLAWVSAVVVILVPAAIAELASVLRPAWSVARVGPVAGLSVILATSLLLPTFTARRYIALVQDSFDLPKTIAITRHGRTFYVSDDPALAHSIESLLDAVAAGSEAGEPGHRGQHRSAARAQRRQLPLLPPAGVRARHILGRVRARPHQPPRHAPHPRDAPRGRVRSRPTAGSSDGRNRTPR